MHVLIARFTYEGMTPAEFEASAVQLAPNFAAVPGCIEKTWIIDPEARRAGGVYKFRDRNALDAYLASDLWAAVLSTPQFTNLTTEVFGTVAEATRITRGLAEAVPA